MTPQQCNQLGRAWSTLLRPKLAVFGTVTLGDEGGEDAAPEEDEAILSRTSAELEDELAAEAVALGIPSAVPAVPAVMSPPCIYTEGIFFYLWV